MRMPVFKEKADAHVWIRIFDNQHLLDATEIFRKLNVHKKVRNNSALDHVWAYIDHTC